MQLRWQKWLILTKFDLNIFVIPWTTWAAASRQKANIFDKKKQSSKNQLVVYFSKNLPWNFKTVLTLMCTSALCQEECHDVQLYTYDHGWCLLPEFSRFFSSIFSNLSILLLWKKVNFLNFGTSNINFKQLTKSINRIRAVIFSKFDDLKYVKQNQVMFPKYVLVLKYDD